jgi:alkanesulfonate monooxygenase SsuD/methylene tetrahydromethanopterin reductase-like flavin-dependent oxidoreductase (luciferase family)
MRVGVIVPMGDEPGPENPRSYAQIKAFAVAVEEAGLDSVWVYDHLLAEGPDDPENSPWEAWSVLCGLVEATSRVRLGALVMCTSFRHAGVLARMADTVQEMSGNRLVLGIGAGWHEPEYRAFGLPFEPRVSGFAEAAKVVTEMLRNGRATVPGRFHGVDGAPVRERPGRVAPEILIAARRPRMLRLAAQYADSWNLAWYGFPSPLYLDVSRALDDACNEIGRDPGSLERTVGILYGLEGEGDEARAVRGDAQRLADALRAWRDEGMTEVIISPMPSNQPTLEAIAEAVAMVRE